MGVDEKFAHQKKKEDGRPKKKKKEGETPIFFKLNFGAHLSPIPTWNLKIYGYLCGSISNEAHASLICNYFMKH